MTGTFLAPPWQENIPSPSVTPPQQCGSLPAGPLRPALPLPRSITSTLSHKLPGLGARARSPAHRSAAVGEGKASPATRSPLLPPGVRCPRMDRRDGLQLLHKTISPQRHQPLHRTEGRAREKQSPGESSSSGKLAPAAEPPLLLLAFLSLCALKTAILEEQEDPNHDICVKMKGMQMFGVFCLDLEFLVCST